MLPLLKGPAPLAIVLCRFNDVPVLDIPRARFFDFISQYGRGGLFDFWRDVSYGAIDLTGSEVFGWYTMKYSFVQDGADPFKNGTQGRFAWIAEAIRLAKSARVWDMAGILLRARVRPAGSTTSAPARITRCPSTTPVSPDRTIGAGARSARASVTTGIRRLDRAPPAVRTIIPPARITAWGWGRSGIRGRISGNGARSVKGWDIAGVLLRARVRAAALTTIPRVPTTRW